MPDLFPTLSVKPSLSSAYGSTLRLINLKLGDGYEQRVGDGENNDLGNYQIVYEALDVTDKDTLNTFIQGHRSGETITVPNYILDSTGATTSNFYIVDYLIERATAPNRWDFRIRLQEVVS